MKIVLHLLAPYFAVGIFWCGFENAWLALLAYHVQIIAWSWRRIPVVVRGKNPRATIAWGTLFALVGPVLYALLPHIASADLRQWSARYGISGASWMLMIPYYGIVHPILEEAHWEALRARTAIAHLAFAGYHALVLLTLLPGPWIAVAFLVLASASAIWHHLTRKYGGSFVPAATHLLADISLVVATWLRVR